MQGECRGDAVVNMIMLGVEISAANIHPQLGPKQLLQRLQQEDGLRELLEEEPAVPQAVQQGHEVRQERDDAVGVHTATITEAIQSRESYHCEQFPQCPHRAASTGLARARAGQAGSSRAGPRLGPSQLAWPRPLKPP